MSTASLAQSKEERALRARREREAERLMRLKDPSKCGKVDPDALSAQISEKQAAKAAAAALDAAYDRDRVLMDQQIAYLEQQRRKAEREKLKELQQFRATHQGKEKAREFDLNNPNSKLESQPARSHDEDPRLSVSGMQKFQGEDLTYAHRVKAQQENLRQWSEEATAAKAAAKDLHEVEEKVYSDSMVQMDAMKAEMEAASRAARTQTERSVAEYNLALAAAKRKRERSQQIEEMQRNVEEIQNALAGSALQEDPVQGRSFVAANRLRPDHYKGMTAEEQQAILVEQELQRRQKTEAMKQERAEKQATIAELEGMRIAREYHETIVDAKRAEMRKQILEENWQLAQEQASNKAFLAKTVYANRIDDKFFSQFNTSAR